MRFMTFLMIDFAAMRNNIRYLRLERRPTVWALQSRFGLTHGIEKRQLFSFPKCNNCWHGCMCLV